MDVHDKYTGFKEIAKGVDREELIKMECLNGHFAGTINSFSV